DVTLDSRRSLPSPEAMLGQPWSHWVDAAKLHGNDDMPIFGLCPAHDDFYLVMCNHCNQVVKPQAFQSHYGSIKDEGWREGVMFGHALMKHHRSLFMVTYTKKTVLFW
uniref:Ataxin 7 n=1 Tax=Nothoprocta perdicaria TaxID=30464 RepID=A0A8C6YWI8_NOTPE